MKNLNLLIVEDDVVTAKRIAEYLEKLGYTIIGTTSSGEEALEIMNSKPIDIVLMDIRLKGTLDGIETAKRILKEWDVDIIYITDIEDEEVFKRARTTFPKNYLTKPLNLRQLNIAIDLAIADGESNTVLRSFQNKYAFLYFSDNSYKKVTVEDICIIEANGPYTKIFIKGNDTPLKVSISSNKIYKKLNSQLLLKVHKSFYINMERVDSIENKILILDGKKIPVSPRLYKGVLKHFNILKRN